MLEGLDPFVLYLAQITPCRATTWGTKLESDACFFSVDLEHEE